jgi:hypothetical protein
MSSRGRYWDRQGVNISRFVCITGGNNNSSQRTESWDHMHMVVAVNAVRRRDVGLKKAAKSFNVL